MSFSKSKNKLKVFSRSQDQEKSYKLRIKATSKKTGEVKTDFFTLIIISSEYLAFKSFPDPGFIRNHYEYTY